MSKFIIGLDLGQAADYTALAIVEKHTPITYELVHGERRNETPTGETSFTVRHLERVPLRTSYPDIVKRVQKLAASPPLTTAQSEDYKLIVDATGVGAPVVDMIRAAGLRVIGLTITGGQEATGDDWEGWNVPKKILVSNLLLLMQSGRLKFAEGLPEVSALVKELLAFQVKITLAANDTYGSWREGSHDDLILAVAMAAWYGETKTFSTHVTKNR